MGIYQDQNVKIQSILEKDLIIMIYRVKIVPYEKRGMCLLYEMTAGINIFSKE